MQEQLNRSYSDSQLEEGIKDGPLVRKSRLQKLKTPAYVMLGSAFAFVRKHTGGDLETNILSFASGSMLSGMISTIHSCQTIPQILWYMSPWIGMALFWKETAGESALVKNSVRGTVFVLLVLSATLLCVFLFKKDYLDPFLVVCKLMLNSLFYGLIFLYL